MVMGGNGGDSAMRGGGLAARASRRSFEGDAPGEGGDRRAGFSAARAAEGAVAATSSTGSERAGAHTPASQRQGQRPGQASRVKRLAAIVAVSVALSVVSLAYGVWASAASRAAVDEATSGALPTLVAASDIHAGDALSTAAVEAKEVPFAYRSAGALGVEALGADGALEEGRALVDIPAGTQIASSFVAGLGGDRLSSGLASGKEAVTLAVDVETGLAGRVRPYDTVRVVSAEGASSGEAFLETICERARVVAVGDDATGAQSASASVTVEVTPSEADAVRQAQYAGRVSLVLVAASDVLGEEEPDGQDD